MHRYRHLAFETLESRNLLAGDFIASLNAVNFATDGQTANVQILGPNALPATDVPGSWPTGSTLSIATPWALVDGTLAPLGGVTRTDSLETTTLGNFAALARVGHSVMSQQAPANSEKPEADGSGDVTVVEELPSPFDLHAAR